jgi:predicted DNA-binding transcriptional regulator AlpA
MSANPLLVHDTDSAAALKGRRLRLLFRLAVNAEELGELLGCGERSIRTWDAAGKLPKPFRLGTRTLWSVGEIRRWMDAGAPTRQEWEEMKRLQKSVRSSRQ